MFHATLCGIQCHNCTALKYSQHSHLQPPAVAEGLCDGNVNELGQLSVPGSSSCDGGWLALTSHTPVGGPASRLTPGLNQAFILSTDE
jgi:hypothetical protein